MPHTEENSARERTILIVEDNEDDVFILRRAFAKAGAPAGLRVVANGAEARAYLEGEAAFRDRSEFPLPDIIVCDFKLPPHGGTDFLKWLREQKQHEQVPFVFLSGYVSPQESEMARDLGANLCLEKTGDFTKMMEHAHEILRLMGGGAARSSVEGVEGISREHSPLVLVIDDEPGMQRMIAEVLGGSNLRVLPALSSLEGLACARARRPDVVLCDLVLPDISGARAAEAIRDLPAMEGVPIIYMTGYPYMAECLLDRKAPVLYKPFSASAVVERVMQSLEEKGQSSN